MNDHFQLGRRLQARPFFRHRRTVLTGAMIALAGGLILAAGMPSTGTRASGPQVAPTHVPPTATRVPSPTATPEVYRSFALDLTREDEAWRKNGDGDSSVLGRSVQGREVVAHRFGDGDRLVVLVGGLHQGPEGATSRVVEGLMAALTVEPNPVPEGLTLVVIPMANPDGASMDTRLNARDVDLNRNWPTADWADPAVHGIEVVNAGAAPLSEPETAMLYRYFQATLPVLVIGWHGYASVVEGNDIAAAEAFAAVFADAAGYELLEKWPYYPITGEMIVALAELGIPAFDVELDSWTTVEMDIERNLAGLIQVLAVVNGDEGSELRSATAVPEVAP